MTCIFEVKNDCSPVDAGNFIIFPRHQPPSIEILLSHLRSRPKGKEIYSHPSSIFFIYTCYFYGFYLLIELAGCSMNLKINRGTCKLTRIYKAIKKNTTVAKLKLLKFGTLSSYDTWIFLDVRRSLIHRPRKHKSC